MMSPPPVHWSKKYGLYLVAGLAVALAALNTWAYLHWVQLRAETVQDYLRYLGNLDTIVRYFRQLEPVYLLGLGATHALTHLPSLTLIDASRFVLQVLTFFFAGAFILEVTRRPVLAVIGLVLLEVSAGFWSLSINLLRNFTGLMLFAALLWVLVRLLGARRQAWSWRILAGLLLGAIIATHIVMLVLALGTLFLFFLLTLIRGLADRPRDLRGAKSLVVVAIIGLLASAPYSYIRFYKQQFYRTHEYKVPVSELSTPKFSSQDGLRDRAASVSQGLYLLFVNFTPDFVHRTVYFIVLIGAIGLLALGLRQRDPPALLVVSAFLATFLASRNEVFGLALLPDRFILVLFFPLLLVLVLWYDRLSRERWMHPTLARWALAWLIFLQLTLNALPIALRLHVGERSYDAVVARRGQRVVPDQLFRVITPDQLKREKYTGPTTIDGYEDSIVTRTPGSLELFETSDAETAWRIARELNVGYLYLDTLYYDAYHDPIRRAIHLQEEKFYNERYFRRIFVGYKELSKVQLFEIRPVPEGRDRLVIPRDRGARPLALTSSEDVRLLKKLFDESIVDEWVTDFVASGPAITTQEFIKVKGGQVYRLDNEAGLQSQIVPGFFFNRLIVERPDVPLVDRWRVRNSLKGFISDGFLIYRASPNIARQLAWRVEQRDFALYLGYAVDPHQSRLVEVHYITRDQFQLAAGFLIFTGTLLVLGLTSGVSWWRRGRARPLPAVSDPGVAAAGSRSEG